jgi:hypothetical protein
MTGSCGPTELVNDILRELSRGETRLFRQNAGFAWQGQVIEQSAHRLILAHPRAIKLGVPGMADLGGLTSILITPEMIGQRIAIDLQIEAKFGSGRATPEQRAYIETMRSLGARAGIARSVEDARRITMGLIL